MRITTQYVVTFQSPDDIRALMGICSLAQEMITHHTEKEIAAVAPSLDIQKARSLIDTLISLERTDGLD